MTTVGLRNDARVVIPLFVDVVFTHAEVEPLDVREFDVIAVIDVLRATTTVVTALENGARGVVPVATPEDARDFAATKDGVLLAGERGARIIPGFHLGNSPLEYVPSVVSGKLIALTTTNGTQAFQRVQGRYGEGAGVGGRSGDDLPAVTRSTYDRKNGGPIVVAACLRNAAAVARTMARASSAGGSSALLVCAGTEGRFSSDDAYCAAIIVARLSRLISTEQGEGARAVTRMYDSAIAHVPADVCSRSVGPAPRYSSRGGPIDGALADLSAAAFEELRASRHGQRLLNMGLYRDVKYCAETDVSDVVPRLIMGMLVREGTGENVVNK